MTIADSSRASIAYVEEPPTGLAGTEVFRLLRNAGSSLEGSITASPTEEIRADRQISGSSHISASNSGDINLQLSYGEYDDFLEAVLESAAWTNFTATATDFVNATSTITLNTTAGLIPEQGLRIDSAVQAGNNGVFTIATVVDATSVTVNETLTDETTASANVVSSMISNGTTTRNFAVETANQDVTEFALSEGLKVGSMKFALGNSQISGGFSLMGTNFTRSGASVSVGGIGSYNPSLVNDVLNGASGIDSISIQKMNADGSHDAASAEIFESIDVTMDNTLREQPGLGSLYPVGIGRGRFSADLAANMYFQTRAMFTNFVANDVMTIRFALTDDENDIAQGNAYLFSFPGCRIQSYNAPPDTVDADIMAKVSFKAVLDPYLTQKTCIVTRFPAP